MSDEKLTFTKAEVEGFFSKLQQWGATLAPRERALLYLLMDQAGAALPGEARLSDDQLAQITAGLRVQMPIFTFKP
jgi:hypothetical protein